MKHAPQFFRDVRESIASYAKLNVVCGVVSGLFVPTLVGAFCTYYEPLVKINPILFWGPVLVLIAFSSAYCIAVLNVKSSPESFFEIQELSDEIDGLKRALEHLATVDYLCNIWRIMVDENVRQKLVSSEDAREAINKLCDLFLENVDSLYHFSRDELWNFALYIYDAKQDTLRPLWRRKHRNHPATGAGRLWRPGQGHVGLSFANGTARTTADARASEVAELLRAPGALHCRYDETVYVALQTEPIRAADGRILGVLAATSDRAGRYDKANGLALVHLSGEIATLLSLAWDRPLTDLVIW